MSPIDPDSDFVGQVEGLPAYRCHPTETGAWCFRCHCGRLHLATSREGPRKASYCDLHAQRGLYLLPPELEDEGAE